MYLSSRARAHSLARAALLPLLLLLFLLFLLLHLLLLSLLLLLLPSPSPRSYRRRHDALCRPFRSPLASPPFLLCFRLSSTSRSRSPRVALAHTCNATHNTTVCAHPRTSLHAVQVPVPSPCLCALTRVRFSSLSSLPSPSSRPIPIYLSLRAFPSCTRTSHRTHTNGQNGAVPEQPRRIVASVLRALTDFSISILFSRIRRNITARC